MLLRGFAASLRSFANTFCVVVGSSRELSFLINLSNLVAFARVSSLRPTWTPASRSVESTDQVGISLPTLGLVCFLPKTCGAVVCTAALNHGHLPGTTVRFTGTLSIECAFDIASESLCAFTTTRDWIETIRRLTRSLSLAKEGRLTTWARRTPFDRAQYRLRLLLEVIEALGCAHACCVELAFLLPVFFLRKTLHVHFDATLETWLGHVGEWDVVFALWSMASGVLDELLQTALLTVMDVLLIVLLATDLFQFVLVRNSEFKLVKCLTKHTLSRHLQGLARIVGEA